VRVARGGSGAKAPPLAARPKLTGWLASLDLAAPTQRLILSHQMASPHALYDVLVWDRGRGKTMNNLVDSDRELPVNLAKLNLAKLQNDRGLHNVPDSGELLINYHHIFSTASGRVW